MVVARRIFQREKESTRKGKSGEDFKVSESSVRENWSRHEGGTHLLTHMLRHLESVCGLPPPPCQIHTYAFYDRQTEEAGLYLQAESNNSQHPR
ncbi:hypothetical protein FQN60_012850 [Etheostoma spectabile]|uniref:Uncharacterized protein n=1 Tax=Etheostoma spectabile TaxID=54343 RepID=A0A5J5DA76_9PERO|nr:hypothetical protein FQN60_012850 [Etheostoma spectabile]